MISFTLSACLALLSFNFSSSFLSFDPFSFPILSIYGLRTFFIFLDCAKYDCSTLKSSAPNILGSIIHTREMGESWLLETVPFYVTPYLHEFVKML